jgi:signal transduction histidine kinase/ligand-binding sensor domain-containing protein/DNA-binding response OmpR family regulator
MHLKRLLLTWFVIMLITSMMFAENQPTIEHITSDNGLSHNTIRCMIQDRTGFLWFGSLNGLNRYDGIRIKNLKPKVLNFASLSSGKIKELHQDSNGHIWIRTYSDMMHCYDPNTENFISIFDNKEDQSIKHNLYYEDRQRNIWLGSVSSGCVKISFNKEKITSQKFTASQKPNSIPSNTVNDILQDSHFNTWIMTSKGIAMINGNQFINIREGQTGDNNFIKAFELKNKIYFISATGRIKVYNLTNGRFERITLLKPTAKVFQTVTFGKDKILVSTYKKGVFIYSTTTGQYISGKSVYLENITGNAYFQTDKLGNVWTYNLTGNVWMLNPKINKVRKLNLIPPSILQLIDEERFQFVSDKHGNVWISTYGNGLFCYNIRTENISHYVYNKNTNGLASNYLLSIVLDRTENIWVGTENMGVNKLSFANRNVQILYPDPEYISKNGNVIKSFIEDKNQNIWVSTKAGNLYKYDPTLSSKKTIIENGYNVYCMIEDNTGSVWLGTKRNGIIELKNGEISNAIHYQTTDKPGSLGYNTIFSLLKDRKGRLWVATFGGGVCVKTTPEGTEGFRTFFNEDEWVKFTRYIFMDRSGDIWVATTNGVLRFNPDELLQNRKAYKYYTYKEDSKNCLSNPEVRYIFQDSKGYIWLATAGGLNKFIGESSDGNGIFKVYNIQQGMSNDNIMSIQEDKTGCLWVSTESGLHKLSPKNNLFLYYKFSDDFSSNIFSEAACLTSHNGRMYWGSLNGFYVFNPNSLNLNRTKKNNVVLTGFFIYDQEAKIDANYSPLEQSVSLSKEIVLKASDKVFHIEFSNLNFKDPKANQFMYILDNYEKRWNLSGTFNVATYRNVPPGKYIFKVKSINNEGIWDDNNITSLEITIKPPFWRTNFALFIYLILLSALLYLTFRLILNFNRLNNAVKIERQLTDYKLRFFTNISHEFRTPLTLIKGSVDTLNELKSKMNDPFQHLVEDLDKNTSHMMRLIDQLMEFRKLQNNKQTLHLQDTDVVSFIREIYISFSNVASKSNIEYQYLPSCASFSAYIDRNKVDKIVFNLLSNAFKFTHRGGKITLLVETDNSAQLFRISVSDNGIGVPKEKQNLLFSRFMQINFSANGTGVGLSLVNEFTTIHKGNVHFKENEGGGSVFIIELPLNKDIYSKDDFVTEQFVVSNEDKKEVYNISDFIDQNDNEIFVNLVPNVPAFGKKYKVLVIDDNDDIRDFLNEKLSPYFEIITAENGDEGIKRSMEDDPDLIICDVMMPGMTGFELTKKLKDDFATCHIPVILLTAYISDEYLSEGIEAGADAYISKPFSMKHLMLQINKLIEKREKLNKHYSSNEPAEELKEDIQLEVPDRDSQFLVLVEEILEQHLTDPEFSVDEFASLANTGRTLFFKKIKYLTGYTPNDFIRVRRMKKAAELLKTFKYNVSEVSYMVGINDPFYFSKCFKAQFGCSPSHYINS